MKRFDRPEASATSCRRRGVFVAYGETDGPLSEGFRAVQAGARLQFRVHEGGRGPEAIHVEACQPSQRGTSYGTPTGRASRFSWQ